MTATCDLLKGIVVIDAASFIAGPSAATVMSDFGAEVIKVEPPALGDSYRYLGMVPLLPSADESYTWILTGRNKRSIQLDLKSDEAHDVLDRLLRRADVFITNAPPEVSDRLHLGYARISEINERIVYAGITGYGEAGPDANRRAFDVTAWWARSGIAHTSRSAGAPPAMLAPGAGDHPTAMSLVAAIMMGLYQRERTGRGCKVSTSLFANGLWANGVLLQAALLGAPPYELRAPENMPTALTNFYCTRDGRWFFLAGISDPAAWPHIVELTGDVENISEEFPTAEIRASAAGRLVAILRTYFAACEWEELEVRLRASRVAYTPVSTCEEVLADPQLQALNLLAPIATPAGRSAKTLLSPIEVDGHRKRAPARPPDPGEHTLEILDELGFDEDAIERLRKRGAIS